MTARYVAAISGSLLGVSTHVSSTACPSWQRPAPPWGFSGSPWAWTRPEPIQAISDAVIYEAHDAARRLRDDDGQDAIAAELERREEVRRG